MMRHPSRSRAPRKGFALLVVLVGALLIGGLATTLRARGAAQASVLGRIEAAHRTALSRMSVTARVAASLTADDGTAPRTDGTPTLMTQDGRDWEVRLADVEGLVDLYLAPPGVLALLAVDGDALARQREGALGALVPGARFGSEEHTLARFGFDAARRAELAPLVTQRARTGEINPALAPPGLREAAALLPSGGTDAAGGDLAELTIRLLP